jgi:hypothetical protein
MKQYVVDELRPEDYDRLKAYLDANFDAAGVDGLYWLPVMTHLLTDVQKDHGDCAPFVVALELEPRKLSCELLVRTTQRVRCSCIGYATPDQREWLIQSVDAVFEKLDLTT